MWSILIAAVFLLLAWSWIWPSKKSLDKIAQSRWPEKGNLIVTIKPNGTTDIKLESADGNPILPEQTKELIVPVSYREVKTE